MDYFANKENNIKVFKSLCSIISKDTDIKNNIERSIMESMIYSKEIGDFVAYTSKKINCISFEDMEDRCDKTTVKFELTNTIDSAINNMMCTDYRNIALLNFASAKHPGGMVLKGSSAQEECICRSTNLYHILSDSTFYKPYYKYHKDKKDDFYSSTLIYTPNVFIILDGSYVLLNDPLTVDVITSPFPNLRNINYQIDEDILNKIYDDRIDNVFRAAIDNDVDCLILGAWGCGVFKNDPKLVAKSFKRIIDKYDKKIVDIVFAIIDEETYNIFRKEFEANG